METHGDRGLLLLHGNTLHRRSSFLHYEDWSFFQSYYYCFITLTTIGFVGLCSPAEEQSFAGEAPLCGIQLHVHSSGADGYWGLSQPGGPSFPDHEHEDERRDARGEGFPGGEPQ